MTKHTYSLISFFLMSVASLAYGKSTGIYCLSSHIETCIKQIAIDKFGVNKHQWQSELKTKNLPNEHMLKLSDDMHAYHQSLLNVLPNKSQRLRTYILGIIASKESKHQTSDLIKLALIEAFSGDTSTANKTITHAVSNNPDDHYAISIKHLINSMAPTIKRIANDIGFNHNICNNPTEEAHLTIKTAVSANHRRLIQSVSSVPDIETKLRLLMLISAYNKKLNPCQFSYQLYDHEILNTLTNIPNRNQFIELSTALIPAYNKMTGFD